MSITANDTKRKSWLEVPENRFSNSKYSFRSFSLKENVVTVGTRIGTIDLELYSN
jgi:fumarylacetoacetase